jgi:unsaturated chondroitin disaccharide hydrolase
MRPRSLAIVVVLAAAVLAPTANAAPSPATASNDLAFARSQLRATAESLVPTAWPWRTTSTGAWQTREAGWWTSGFFSGSLWLTYGSTGEPSWRSQAERWQAGLESQRNNTSTHDVGFMVFNSFGNGYKHTGVDAYRHVVLDAAESLASRFSPVVGATRSWGGPSSPSFTVIVDNMMNLELLFWAARNGGNPAFQGMATSHALKTMEHFVRSDGSTYHVVEFDPATGAVQQKRTHQGLSAESTWSRGQAWAIHGFAIAYRETGDPRFLSTARRLADYFITHLPTDKIPFWDFDAAGPGEPRDSSAAAIAASGLLELARLEPDSGRAASFRAASGAILDSLSAAYLARGTSDQAILLHGTGSKPHNDVDRGYVFGDYYYVEALLRWGAAVDGSLPGTAQPPLAAVDGSLPGTARPPLTMRIKLPRDGRSLTRFLRRGLPVGVYSDAAGQAAMSLTVARSMARRFSLAAKPRRVTIAKSRRRLARPGWSTAKLRPSRRVVRRLRRARVLKAQLSLRFATTDRQRSNIRRALTFRR